MRPGNQSASWRQPSRGARAAAAPHFPTCRRCTAWTPLNIALGWHPPFFIQSVNSACALFQFLDQHQRTTDHMHCYHISCFTLGWAARLGNITPQNCQSISSIASCWENCCGSAADDVGWIAGCNRLWSRPSIVATPRKGDSQKKRHVWDITCSLHGTMRVSLPSNENKRSRRRWHHP